MKPEYASTTASSPIAPRRHWRAELSLQFDKQPDRTRLAAVRHQGPLRVQRPFYPENNGCSHVYLLHPPGGIAVGDELDINVRLEPGAHALLTTPSAGRIYGTKQLLEQQHQRVTIQVAHSACIEWLPQETIVFNEANARLQTRIALEDDADFFAWDIVRLGRAASGEQFSRGSCVQTLSVEKNGQPWFIEKNRIRVGEPVSSPYSAFPEARWGLNGKNTFGTLFASVSVTQSQYDTLYDSLKVESAEPDCWSMTQKNTVFIARYLGNDVEACRRGFTAVWQFLRPLMVGDLAVIPRIWNT